MIVALIHWRIRPDEASREAFLAHWRNSSLIVDRSSLIGEFLTEAFPRRMFRMSNMRFSAPSAEYRSYFTFGLWQNLRAFEQAVSTYIPEEGHMLWFEQAPRERDLFHPVCYRIGEANLPLQDSPDVR